MSKRCTVPAHEADNWGFVVVDETIAWALYVAHSDHTFSLLAIAPCLKSARAMRMLLSGAMLPSKLLLRPAYISENSIVAALPTHDMSTEELSEAILKYHNALASIPCNETHLN